MPEKIVYQIDVEPGNSVQTLGQLEEELAQINEELKDVPLNSQSFDDLTAQSQKLTRELDKTNLAIAGVTDEDRIRGFQGSVDIVAGSIAGFTGALGLLNIESEEFEKYTAYAANAIALAEGMRLAAQGAVDLRETLKKAAIAQKGFNKATLANPYIIAGVALVATIGAVAAKFDTFTKAIGDAGINTEGFSKFFSGFGDIFAGVANVIAFKAGKIVAGFIHLINFDFKKAGQSFLEFGSVANIPEVFTEGVNQSQAARFEAQGKADAEAYVEGLNEGAARTPVTAVSAITSTGVDMDPLEEAQITADAIDEVTAAQMRADAANKLAAATIMDQANAEDERTKNLIIASAAFQTLGEVIGSETAAGKALASASALINTYLGASQVISDKTIPTIAKIPAVAAIIAAGISTVKKINEVQVPGSATGPGGAGGGFTAPPPPPVPRDIGLTPESIAEQQTVRAYVVSGDVTTTQEAEAKLRSKRTLGRV